MLVFLVVPIAGCSNSNNYDDITTISTYTKKQYDSGKLTLNTIIKNDSIDNYENDKTVSELFSNTYFSYKSVMHDEETVIIQKNVIFQSVTGYVTTKKNLDTILEERFRYPIMNVTESLGYDNDIIMVEECLGGIWGMVFI